jgi:hypothetical protein
MLVNFHVVQSEAFAATGFDKIFSSDQPRQMNKSLMMKTETVLETSVSFIHLTRLFAREDFIDLPC